MENSSAVPPKIKNGTIMCSGNPPSRSGSERPKSRNMHCCLHTHVHSHVSHSSQKVQTAQVASDRWTEKQHGVYRYSGTPVALKKGGKC